MEMEVVELTVVLEAVEVLEEAVEGPVQERWLVLPLRQIPVICTISQRTSWFIS